MLIEELFRWLDLTPSVALLGLLGIAGAHFLKKGLEKELARSKAEQQERLEHIKADLTKEQAALSLSMNSALSAANFGHQERLRAVAVLWKSCRDLRGMAGPAITFWETIGKKGNLTADGLTFFANVLNLENLNSQLKELGGPAEEVRPFLAGTPLWSLYSSYNLLIGRATIPLGLAFKENDEPESFWKDKGVVTVISEYLNEEERGSLMKSEIKLTWLFNFIEGKIERAAEEIVSGRTAAREAYSQSSEISLLVAEHWRSEQSVPRSYRKDRRND